MGQAADFCGLASHPKEIRNGLVTLVHDDHCHLAVRIQEGCGKQLAPAWRAGNSPGARPDKLRKMSDVVVRIGVGQLPRFGVRMNGSEAEIADVIWTTLLIQKHVPVCPADGATIEVIDHRTAILLT